MKKDTLVESILNKVIDLKDLGKNAEKAAAKLLKDNTKSGCIGVAVILINKVGSSCATAGNKSELKNKDLVKMLKGQVASLEAELKKDQGGVDEEADKLFDKLQNAVDEMDDKEALIEVMTEAAISTALTGATALDGLKKVNKAVGSVLTDSELEILDKNLRKKHEEQDDDDEE